MKTNDRAKQFIGQDTKRRDLLTPEREHDPYKAAAKPGGPLRCPSCQAVFTRGRWAWAKAAPKNAREHVCPACARIRDHYPAGIIRIEGAFASRHRDEILNLAHNCQAREASDHPMSRIVRIAPEADALEISTTDLHLPRVIGNALERAFKRQAEFNYDREGYFVRVLWRRDDE